jgi:hypothetical protein
MGIRLAWRSFQAAIKRSASFEDLGIGCTPVSRFLLRDAALVLHLAAIEAHSSRWSDTDIGRMR